MFCRLCPIYTRARNVMYARKLAQLYTFWLNLGWWIARKKKYWERLKKYFLVDGFWEEDNEKKEQPLQRVFVPLNSTTREEEGQNNLEWSEVLDDFGSRKVHEERVGDLMRFENENFSSVTLEINSLRKLFSIQNRPALQTILCYSILLPLAR